MTHLLLRTKHSSKFQLKFLHAVCCQVHDRVFCVFLNLLASYIECHTHHMGTKQSPFMVKVCVLARSFLDFKVFRQRKIDFPYFGRCFASYYDVLEDAKSYKCFFLFCGHTVHTFLPNSQTEPAFIFYGISNRFVFQSDMYTQWLGFICKVVLILEMICSEMLFHFILTFCYVVTLFLCNLYFQTKLQSFSTTQLNLSTVLSKFSGSPFISPSSSSNALFLNASCSFPLTLLKAPLLILHSGLCWIYKFFGLFGILFNHTIYLTTVFSRLSMVDISFTISLLSSADASSPFILLINMQQK